jgi:hypothetical protein
LKVYPLEWDQEVKGVSEKVIRRGRLFEDLRGFHFKLCAGRRGVKKEDMFGQVIETFKPVRPYKFSFVFFSDR